MSRAVSTRRTANSSCEQRMLAMDRTGTACLRVRRGFLRGLRALPRGNAWPHVVEVPYPWAIFNAISLAGKKV